MVLMKVMVQVREIRRENVAGDLPRYTMVCVGYMVFVAWGKRTWTSESQCSKKTFYLLAE